MSIAKRAFSFSYPFQGSQWAIEIWASSPEEAIEKFEHLKAEGKYEFEVLGVVHGGIDLELVETERLIAELFKRFDSAVFAGSIFQPIEKDSKECISTETRRFDGNLRVCQGLAFGVIGDINKRRDQAWEEAGGV